MPQTKPGRYIVSLSYHTDMCVLSYCDQWSFRFICIPWVYMLEHSLRDKIQYHMSWHVEFTSNLVILKSLIFSSLLDFKSLQQWTFSVQLSVKTGLSCVNLHGFWESNGWKGGVSLQRGKVFLYFSNCVLVSSFPGTIIYLYFSVHFCIAHMLFRDLRMCNTFCNVVYTAWYRAIYNPGLIKDGGRKLYNSH